MSSIGWLHLTDLHIGARKETLLYSNVRQEFFDDLRFLHKESGPWHVVFFTGDLTFSGADEQFNLFQTQFWQRLLEHLRTLGSTPVLVPVPGNHDLQRARVNGPVLKVLEHYSVDADIRAALQSPQGEGEPYHRQLREAFHAYTLWLNKQPISGMPTWRAGLFPGDFTVTLQFRGLKLGIVGLNTATLHLGDQFTEGKLALPVGQFLHLVPDPPDLVEQHDVLVLLTHHPLSWISPAEHADFWEDIWPTGRFDVHLHGHMHKPSSELKGLNTNKLRHIVQGASIFGLEHLSDGTTERIHGYSAGRFFVADDEVTTTLWPRVTRKVGDGSRRLGADLSFDLDRRRQSYSVPVHRDDEQSTTSQFVSFHSIAWDTLFRSASKLELITNYADSWFQQHLDALRDFLRRGGYLSILLPDPNDSLCLSTLRVRYPDYSTLAMLFEKVAESARRILRLAEQLAVTSAVEVCFTSNPPSYWALRVDERTVYLSPFENRREERVRAPVFTVEATQEPSRSFWNKEFAAFAQGTRIQLAEAITLKLVGQPGARVQKFADRAALYLSVRDMIMSARSAVYDTSWGWEPVPYTGSELKEFRNSYREAITTKCTEGNVNYREIVDVNVAERVARATDMSGRLETLGKRGQYHPRFLRLSESLPMLEYLVVDSQNMIISGLGADQKEFLRIQGGVLPALVASYLEKVWRGASDIPEV